MTGALSSAGAVLRAEGLRFRYGELIAVDGVGFSVAAGECLGLLGPNGAGKTTVISMLAGLLRPEAGKFAVLGRDARAEGRGARRLVGLVPQELALYEELTAAENLSFFGSLRGLKGEALERAVVEGLALAGLQERARTRVGTFSGGMKRRLNLAVGCLGDPPLLLLDEPTAGVDPQSRNHIFEMVERVREAGRAVLVTTHYMEEAERICDRIAVMDGGRLLCQGTLAELRVAAGVGEAGLEGVFLALTGRELRD